MNNKDLINEKYKEILVKMVSSLETEEIMLMLSQFDSKYDNQVCDDLEEAVDEYLEKVL